MTAAAERGRWTAIIEPMMTRLMRFHLLRKSHVGDGQAVVRKGPDGADRIEAIRYYQVRFELTEVEEGGYWPDPPTIRDDEVGDLRDFLQAIVDCAAQIGITATQPQPDLAGELAVTRDHLEDMRRLVFKRDHQPIARERAPRR